jgi:NitT/TauT family transport system permease protein
MDFLKRVWAYRHPILFVVGLTAIWEIFVRVRGIEAYLLPAPSLVFETLVTRWALIWHHAQVTMLEVVLGFTLGVTGGTLAAIVMSRSKALNRMFYPLIVASQTFPKEALAPLFIVVIGVGLLPKVLIAGMISFFPMTVSAARGLSTPDPMAVELFESMASSRWQRFIRLELPSALPYIFTGMKMSATLSVVGAVVGEFVGASKGLGYLTQKGIDELQTELMFASLIVLGGMGIALYTAVEVVERVGFGRFLRGR